MLVAQGMRFSLPKLWRAPNSSPCGLAAAAVVVVGAIVAVANVLDVVAWVVVDVADVVGALVVAAGAAQPPRREISNSVRIIIKMGLTKVPEPFRPSVILFFAIFLTLLLISTGSDLAVFL